MSKELIIEASLKSTMRGILTAAPIRDKFHKAMYNHHMEHHKEHMRNAAKHMDAMKNSNPNSKKYVFHQTQAMHNLGSAEHHVDLAHHHTAARLNAAGYDKKFIKNFHDKFNANKDKAKSLIAQNKTKKPTAQPQQKPTANKRGRPAAFKPIVPNKAPVKNTKIKQKPMQPRPPEETIPKRKQKNLNTPPVKPAIKSTIKTKPIGAKPAKM